MIYVRSGYVPIGNSNIILRLKTVTCTYSECGKLSQKTVFYEKQDVILKFIKLVEKSRLAGKIVVL